MTHASSHPWRQVAVFTGVFILLLTAIYWQTLWSMVAIWIRSETFTHGFLILPISAWLIWQKRNELCAVAPNSWLLPVPLILGAGFVWLVAALVDVLVIQQLAVVAILILGVVALIGLEASMVIMFPLLFLFFAVPMGEGLVPSMMEFTATFTVKMLQLTGIPVYRDGLYFSIPSGNWSVVEACSGVRYLIASIALGCLYAYLNYSSYKKRFIFIVVSALLPVVANGLRAYIIVMLGHLSGMSLAVGVDHLIYGWLFFGLVIFMLFSIGARWRDSDAPGKTATRNFQMAGRPSSTILISCLVLVVSLSWGVFFQFLQASPDVARGDRNLAAPAGDTSTVVLAGEGTWSSVLDFTVAAPAYFVNRGYLIDGEDVELNVIFSPRQAEGEELVNSENLRFVHSEHEWRRQQFAKASLDLAGSEVLVDESHLLGREPLLVWSWYRVGGTYTSSLYKAKFLEAFAKLTFSRQDIAWIVLSTSRAEAVGGVEGGKKRLQQAAGVLLPQLDTILDQTAGVVQ